MDWERLEIAVRRDPAGRGLASFRDPAGKPLLDKQLAAAVRDLANHATRVFVVTGFAVKNSEGASAETDGPPGAIYLSAMLRAVGIEAVLQSDALGAPLLLAGLRAAALPTALLVERTSLPASHLIAIERVGPSHTAESIAAQYPHDSSMRDEFERLVPPHERDVCHNMRGESIDAHTAPLQRLFENTRATTIGIVDGGNEIGCGAIPWDVLRRAVTTGPIERTACRIATTYTIVAGVSNWGAYALGAGVAVLRGGRDAVEAWTADKQRAIIEAMVRDGGAVDGLTKRREPTVDGLAPDDYLATFDEIRRIALGAT